MYKQITWSKRGKPHNYAEFLCDTKEDIQSLPNSNDRKTAVGSLAVILDTCEVYMLGNDNEWTFLKSLSSEGGEDGKDGQDGYTPVRGVDYWTEADIAEIQQYVDEKIEPFIGYFYDELGQLRYDLQEQFDSLVVLDEEAF